MEINSLKSSGEKSSTDSINLTAGAISVYEPLTKGVYSSADGLIKNLKVFVWF